MLNKLGVQELVKAIQHGIVLAGRLGVVWLGFKGVGNWGFGPPRFGRSIGFGASLGRVLAKDWADGVRKVEAPTG